MNIIETLAAEFKLKNEQVEKTVELIDEGNNGIMIPLHDNKEMATCVVDILKNDEKKQEFVTHAIAFSKRYGFEKVKQELESIYEF